MDDESFSTLSQDQQDKWVRERTSTDEEILLRKTYVLRRISGFLLLVALMGALLVGAMVGLYHGVTFLGNWLGSLI